ncbi:methylaspartate mutase [Actinophytocola xanthii]|uniref:Methylaspartate mutase n=1 Tax=Actinophytocola xanthii TaxID=1912961 RepID=A0A1Q8CK15_9PSEU|nr:methylaspartate mutase [Actinophytocola xanthii]OLF14679.1 methylaspartate mutase [Actinophytocola xanthii]
MTRPSFAGRVEQARRSGELIVQPRMGFSDPALMRAGLLATKAARANTVGTITLDSYTRVRDFSSAARAVAAGRPLNGYPIIAHGVPTTRAMLDGVLDAGFPVQVRHGSAEAEEVVAALVACGLDATEGGPVSYCLPYGRVPLRTAVDSWRRSCRELADRCANPHLESFGGCMMGQLCPPGLLVALTVLEALFFRQNGVRDVSMSLAQQSNTRQDLLALAALRRLATERLGPPPGWHLVVYTYMGLFPRTAAGSRAVVRDAVHLASRAGATRLIVKSAVEASRIPSAAENVQALEHAGSVVPPPAAPADGDNEVYREARSLLEATLDLHDDIGEALVAAFAAGILDVPYCVHDDNAGRARSGVAPDGTIFWSDLGSLPLRGTADVRPRHTPTSAELLDALSLVRTRYDTAATGPEEAGLSTTP